MLTWNVWKLAIYQFYFFALTVNIYFNSSLKNVMDFINEGTEVLIQSRISYKTVCFVKCPFLIADLCFSVSEYCVKSPEAENSSQLSRCMRHSRQVLALQAQFSSQFWVRCTCLHDIVFLKGKAQAFDAGKNQAVEVGRQTCFLILCWKLDCL